MKLLKGFSGGGRGGLKFWVKIVLSIIYIIDKEESQ
jgi:hypothetical protein